MTGSDKQIKWADAIRAKVMRDMDELDKRAAACPKQSTYVASVRSYLEAQTTARWWIDAHNYFEGTKPYITLIAVVALQNHLGADLKRAEQIMRDAIR